MGSVVELEHVAPGAEVAGGTAAAAPPHPVHAAEREARLSPPLLVPASFLSRLRSADPGGKICITRIRIQD